jgi:hypothetical protein
MIMNIDIYTKYIHQVLYECTKIMLVSLLYYEDVWFLGTNFNPSILFYFSLYIAKYEN